MKIHVRHSHQASDARWCWPQLLELSCLLSVEPSYPPATPGHQNCHFLVHQIENEMQHPMQRCPLLKVLLALARP